MTSTPNKDIDAPGPDKKPGGQHGAGAGEDDGSTAKEGDERHLHDDQKVKY
jgi:hypothetical protein